MNKYVISCIAGLMCLATSSQSHADNAHKDWIDLHSISFATGIYSEAQNQINKIGKTDTSTPAGKKASQLIRQGKNLQNKLRASKGKHISKQDASKLQTLIKQMDQTANSGKGSQGACCKRCDKANGKGFAKGKGWNRFWCKATCFNVKGKTSQSKSDKIRK